MKHICTNYWPSAKVLVVLLGDGLLVRSVLIRSLPRQKFELPRQKFEREEFRLIHCQQLCNSMSFCQLGNTDAPTGLVCGYLNLVWYDGRPVEDA